ncbi:MAG: DciA family protein [Pseudomonadota bacterium]
MVQSTGKGFGKKPRHATAVADALRGVIEPALARKAGMTIDLIKAWPEIVDQEFADCTRPEKISWPRRSNQDDPFKPATLIVACDQGSALFFQHSEKTVLERVNLFFGFQAVNRMKIVQKSVAMEARTKTQPSGTISKAETAKLSHLLETVEEPKLRKVLEKLGRGVFMRNSGR